MRTYHPEALRRRRTKRRGFAGLKDRLGRLFAEELAFPTAALRRKQYEREGPQKARTTQGRDRALGRSLSRLRATPYWAFVVSK